jgi:two-component system, cell cycle sensor histidine kinase and response regulator CckA
MIMTSYSEKMSARFQDIVEAAPNLIGVASPTGRVVYLNAAGRRLLGIGPNDDIETHDFRQFVPTDGQAALNDAIAFAVANGSWTGERILLSTTGDAMSVFQVIIAHKDASGAVEYLSTIVRDLTETRRLHAHALQATKMEAAANLAAGTAHGFNNLHTVILMAAGFIKDQVGDQPEVQACVAEILAACERASSLTRRLLAFARMDRPSRPSGMNLNELVRREQGHVQEALGKNIALAIDLAVRVDDVNIDPTDFSQVLICLAENAREAMPRGGTVTIRTSVVPLRETDGQDLTPGIYTCVSFTDDGEGMDDNTQAHLFEPFFTTKSRARADGLGLAAVYGIVKKLCGAIRVKSAPGKGASFDIFLPACCYLDRSPIPPR